MRGKWGFSFGCVVRNKNLCLIKQIGWKQEIAS